MRVVVNAATSVDGKMSTRQREQVAISGPADFDRVDDLRADSDAVLVGIGTVLADDPSLTVDDETRRKRRVEDGRPEHPARVVVDSRARTPTDARVVDDAARTIVLVSDRAPEGRVGLLRETGAAVRQVGDERVDLAAALDTLPDDWQVMVEGGGEVIFSLFEAGLVDRLSVYVGSVLIGGREAPTLADGEGFLGEFPDLDLREVERIDDGVLLVYDVD